MNFLKINYAVCDQLVVSGSNFAIGLILARLMSSYEYGNYVFSFALLSMSIGLLNCTVNKPMNVMGPVVSLQKKNIYFNTLFWMYIFIAFLLSVLFWLIWLFLGIYASFESYFVFNKIAYILVFYLGHDFSRNVLLSNLKFKHVLITDFVAHSIRIVVIFGFFYNKSNLNVRDVLYLYGGTSLLGFLLGLYFSNLKFKFILDREVLGDTFHFSKWTVADWIPFIMTSQLEIYIVTALLGSAATGVLGACRNLVSPLSILLVGFMSFALPYFSKIYMSGGDRILRLSLARFFSILICCVLIYLFLICYFSHDLLKFLFGKFEQHSHLLIYISIGSLLNYLFKPADVYFLVVKKPKYIFISRCISALAVVFFCFPLVKYFGLEGAVIYHALPQLVMCIVLFYFMFSYKSKPF